jgi:hypothetical protein
MMLTCHQVEFAQEAWKEDPFEAYNMDGMKEFVLQINFPHRLLNDPQSSGLSLDCSFAFLRNKSVVRIYKLADLEPPSRHSRIQTEVYMEIKPPIPDDSHKKVHLRGASLGRTACATITDLSCFVHRYTDGPEKGTWREIGGRPRENNWEATCVAISETTMRDDLIVIAVGLKKYDGKHWGRIELYSVWQNDWNQVSNFGSMKIFDENIGKPDSPKTLNFSLDGSTLVCTTLSNQVHGWKLPTTFGQVEKLCATTRQFQRVYFLHIPLEPSSLLTVPGLQCRRHHLFDNLAISWRAFLHSLHDFPFSRA